MRAVAREIDANSAKVTVFEENWQRYSVPKWLCRLVEEQYGSRDKSPLTLEVSGKTTEKFDVGAAVRNEVKAM